VGGGSELVVRGLTFFRAPRGDGTFGAELSLPVCSVLFLALGGEGARSLEFLLAALGTGGGKTSRSFDLWCASGTGGGAARLLTSADEAARRLAALGTGGGTDKALEDLL
jgi:hypothetical protein